MTGELTKLQTYLLDILKTQSGNVTRPELARLIGKPTLNYHDIDCLKRLAEAGLIQIIERKVGPVRVEYLYRAL